MSAPDIAACERYLRDLQNRLCAAFESEDGGRFRHDVWQRPQGGGGDTRVLEDGAVLERAGVNFSLISGEALPPAATRARPQLAGRPYRVMGVSVVVHPRNPYAPTSHCNVRFFTTLGDDAVWWFGGGFDLTPYYGFLDDARQWHRTAQAACAPYGESVYPRLKKWCDEYFYLPHRQEPRGIGGLFFDDWNESGFDASFGLMRSVGDAYAQAYLPILQARKNSAYGERERQWQLYRRGRYVEFNLVHDRGTLFGLQSGGRTESILMSLPPQVGWRYDVRPQPGSAEAALLSDFLQSRGWL